MGYEVRTLARKIEKMKKQGETGCFHQCALYTSMPSSVKANAFFDNRGGKDVLLRCSISNLVNGARGMKPHGLPAACSQASFSLTNANAAAQSAGYAYPVVKPAPLSPISNAIS